MITSLFTLLIFILVPLVTAKNDTDDLDNIVYIMNAEDALKIHWNYLFQACQKRIKEAIDTKYMTQVECHIGNDHKNVLKSKGYKIEDITNELSIVRWK